MRTISRSLCLVLLPLLTTSLLACDEGKDKAEKKSDDKKAEKKSDDKKADKKADDKKADEAEPAKPEPPKGPVFTAKGVMGDEVSLPLVAFDLAEAELPGYTLQVPEGTTAMDKSPSGKKLINTKVNFSMTVSEGAFDKEQAKKTYAIVDAEGKIADEADDHLIYERSGEGGFLFQAGVTVGDKQFRCGTVAGISPFTRRVIDQSVAACKSMAAAGAGDAPAAEPGDAPAP